jgi:hypothetical protein
MIFDPSAEPSTPTLPGESRLQPLGSVSPDPAKASTPVSIREPVLEPVYIPNIPLTFPAASSGVRASTTSKLIPE